MRRRHACLALCIGPVAAQPMGLRICANQSLGEADDGSTAAAADDDDDDD